MTQPQFIIEEVTDPTEIARAQAQDERHRRNNEWLEAHWAEVLPQARGKFLAVAGQEAFIADTAAAAWAWAGAVHPEDDGATVRYVRPEKGPRIYGDRG
jgi:glutathione S-transferase